MFDKATLMLLALAFSAAAVSAREDFKKLTATFKELEARVIKREERSNAVIQIKSAPGEKTADNYQFRIKPLDDMRVTVELFHHTMVGDLGERYEVALDDAVKVEMARQAKLAELLAQDEKARQAANAKTITELTKGKLAFGMKQGDVARIWGTKYRFDTWQQAGSGTMIYDDFRMTIHVGTLDEISPTGELSEEEKKLPMADESR